MSSPAIDFAALAAQWRGPMLRFALLHLQPREEAEDAVQDTLAAMLATDPMHLAGGAARAYLFGILRHKVTDRLRGKYRPEVGYAEAFADDLDDILFDARGHWVDGVAPAAWARPEEQLQSERFFAVVDICMLKLPAKPARVFSMKEFLECDAEEICATLGISKADYWQSMSRARKQIQLCLDQNWFVGEQPC